MSLDKLAWKLGGLRGALLQGMRNSAHSSLRIHPSVATSIAQDAALEIDGALTFGYPRPGSSQRRYSHAGQLVLGESARLRVLGSVAVCPGTILIVGAGVTLEIGDGTYFAGDSYLVFTCDARIGAGCAFAWWVTILDNDLHTIRSSTGQSTNTPSTIDIGDNVWVGHGVSILKGVTIGPGSIVAARAVVTRGFPNGSVLAGVPASLQRRLEGSWEHDGELLRRPRPEAV